MAQHVPCPRGPRRLRHLRRLDQTKYPALDIAELGAEPEQVLATLACLLKAREDRSAAAPEMTALLLGKVA